ncbi:transcription antitermination factor NusB [Brachyspira hyodysenteriae]|uniref:transcription antitermination factor NusB n=1 Tax=Brachyspira hyodysenteriae TaxID=159 RepID=UPI0022CDE0CB|nr:transcription antitermination factor NusB [Brachyspira hyodysenteriae]MCZ9996343.1 transcription antitermination factor NusB [Brachyspira hyodysenteriae]
MSEEKDINNNNETENTDAVTRKAVKKKMIIKTKNKENIKDLDLSSYGASIERSEYMLLCLLYSYEINDRKETINEILSFDYDKKIPENIFEFTRTLVEGTINNLERIDNLIEKYSNNWDIKRIQYVDKSIIRMSIYSLIFLKDIPKSVVIDEAVEISKIFSDKDSYKFVNGILDGIQEKDIQ